MTGRNDSSPMLTSDPTSDSSDTGASGKCNGESNLVNNGWSNQSPRDNGPANGNHQASAQNTDKTMEDENMDYSDDSKTDNIHLVKQVSI